MIGIAGRLEKLLIDRYRIERELGQGGMATVFLAHDQRHDRKVALKVLRPELAAVIGAERFLAEIKTTANLQHPHILPLHDSGEADGLVFYVMPYVEGESLRERLTRERQLPLEDAVRITREVADALHYAHERGIVHRDIKPENILLHGGHAMVADFGIALAASRSEGGTRLTETGMSLGTPHYMSPEQAMGEREITARSDVYSLGCVLYEMLAGEPPFTGPTAQSVVARVMTEQPRSLTLQRSTIPGHIEASVERALQKLPADRFASAWQFAEALSAPSGPSAGRGVGVESGRATPAAVGRVVADSLRQRWVPWALAGVLLVAFLWQAVTGGGYGEPIAPTRFAIDLEQVRSFPGSPSVLVTPDGGTVVANANVDRRLGLVARRLDRFDAAVIPGGQDAERPFLSPDGAWIGFAANGKLMKLPIEGGTPVALADASWGGGAWGDDGTIVYTPNYQSGLWRVSSTGSGEAAQLTQPDTSKGELAHWWPQWLPDGRHLLFTAFRTPIARATIEILDTRTGTRRVLVEGGVMARYADSGHVLFARDESLLAVPFDAGQLTVTGAAVVVVDDVAMAHSEGFAAYAVSTTGTLVTIPSSVAGTRFQLVEADRQGVERVILATPERYNNPRFAPDGRRIALDIAAARSAADVWVVDPERGSRLRVTTEEAADFGAVWTPDGRELIYTSERPLFELYRRAADGSRRAEPLLTGQHDRSAGSVSPDGRILAFVLSVPGGAELWTVPLQGTPEATQYLANGFQLGHPAISPDGRWMAYDSDETGRVEVYIQSFPDATRARRQVSSGGGSEPIWTHGGRELVFRRGGSVMAATVEPASGAVGVPGELFDGPYQDSPAGSSPRSYDVTPDGRRFLLLRWPPDDDTRRRLLVTLGWWPELRARVAGGQPSHR